MDGWMDGWMENLLHNRWIDRYNCGWTKGPERKEQEQANKQRRTTLVMRHFLVFSDAFALLKKTSVFQMQLDCSLEYFLTYWSPGPEMRYLGCLYKLHVSDVFIHVTFKNHVRTVFNFIGAKKGKHDLPLRVKRVRTRVVVVVVVVVVRELLFLVTSVICVRIWGRGS